MLLFSSFVVLGVGFGLFFGGSLKRLTRFPLRYTWLIIAALLIQALILSSLLDRPDLPGNLVPELYVFSFLLLLAAVAVNLKFAGVKIVGVGLLLNLLVIVANGGLMPASIDAMQAAGQQAAVGVLLDTGRAANSITMTQETRLNFLGDRLVFTLQGVPFKAFSIGDTIIAAGVFVLVSQAMLWRRKRWDYNY